MDVRAPPYRTAGRKPTELNGPLNYHEIQLVNALHAY
jgi:hypothetical protein